MKKPFNISPTRAQIIQIAISVLMAAAAGIDMVGHQARLVHIITIVAGSISTGIPLGRFIEQKRHRQTEEGSERS